MRQVSDSSEPYQGRDKANLAKTDLRIRRVLSPTAGRGNLRAAGAETRKCRAQEVQQWRDLG